MLSHINRVAWAILIPQKLAFELDAVDALAEEFALRLLSETQAAGGSASRPVMASDVPTIFRQTQADLWSMFDMMWIVDVIIHGHSWDGLFYKRI